LLDSSAVAVLLVAVLAFAVAVLAAALVVHRQNVGLRARVAQLKAQNEKLKRAAAASDERPWAMESELDLRDRRLTSQNEDIGRLRSTLHRFTVPEAPHAPA
jgi:uncharacterized protein HemX